MKRVGVAGDVRFLTFSCYRRLPLLGHPGIRDRFAERLAAVTDRCDLRLVAWVAMPEHAHLIVQPTGEATVADKGVRPRSRRRASAASESVDAM